MQKQSNTILFNIFTYNRFEILKKSLDSILNHGIDPNRVEIHIHDDGSNQEVLNYLMRFCLEHDCYFHGKHENQGYCRNFYQAFRLTKEINPEYVFFIESDYVFRKDFMQTCLGVYDKLDQLWGINGFSHPDFYVYEKCHTWFADATNQEFGRDVPARYRLYKPFVLNANNHAIKCQFSSHSCGTFLLNWRKLQDSLEEFEEKERFENLVLSSCKDLRRDEVIHDGRLTGGISLLWSDYQAFRQNPLLYSQAAFVDICDKNFSIAQHFGGGGVNEQHIQEGQTSVLSPSWKE